MMGTEVYLRGTNNNAAKNWSTQSIPTLDSLDEGAILESSTPTKARRDSAGPGVPQARRDSTSIFEELKSRGRRSSWHAKLERKRRKGVTAPSSPDDTAPPEIGSRREKRPSFWNIFAKDFRKSRSRRASQDIGHVARNTEVLGPFLRSKSRSVDHGFSAPFDLESLRSKVEGRFESVDRLSKDADLEKKKVEPPVQTIEYTVNDRDTLTSVAARFDTTPSELTKINRLASSFIFAGQVLRVPDRSATPSETINDSQVSTPTEPQHDSHDDLPPEEKELLDSLRPVSPKPGHIERVRTPLGGATSASNNLDPEDEAAFRERFLKINVRHITDGQGVVGGVLLVTPNAIIFDPNVSDPLVIEHGPESYGVIAPMEFVVNAAIYYDIAHMRVGSHSLDSNSKLEKPEIYHAPSSKSSYGKCSPLEDSSLLVKDDTFSELGDDGGGGAGALGGDDADSVCSCPERERGGDAFPKAFDRDLVTPTNLQQGDSSESDTGPPIMNTQSQRTLEERRKSLLDHHWAIPSRDRESQDEPTQDLDEVTTPIQPAANTVTPTTTAPTRTTSTSSEPVNIISLAEPLADPGLVKLSCHDSGIDIREPLPPPIPIVQPNPTKKVYSDADIVLSTDWVPPITIAPNSFTTSSSLETTESPGRKKASSVSFSLDSNNEDSGISSTTNATNITTEPVHRDHSDKDDNEKTETRKNKMLKRLSYPLAWMETFSTGSEEDKVSSLPNSADAHHSSVFSKVFSSSPINLVEFGTGLFLSKTPSEESGGSGGPPSAGLYQLPEGTVPPQQQSTTSSVFDNITAGGGQIMSSALNASYNAMNTTSNVVCSSSREISNAVGRSSVGTFIRIHPNNSSSESSSGRASNKPPQPRLDYRSMVSVDDMPELFVSFDKLIPRPARSCEDPPLYLRLRMGKPSNRPIPRSTPLMSYGKKKMRPEYWFSVPKNRVDDLYRFLQLWVPQRYGELTDDEIRSRGFDPVESDTELWDDDSPTGRSGSSSRNASQDQEGDLTRESWEALSRSEEIRKALAGFSTDSLEVELTPPDLVGTTEILTDEHREKLCRHLPARAEGYLWTLVFSTSQHGFSLNSMYRKMAKLESPILMVIEDTGNNVFGALTSCSLKVSDHFYGTGESLLFRFSPSFQVFNWTGENLYFIKGNNESLSIGAGDGKFGIWLDGDLYQGRTEPCGTYGNDALTPTEDFVVKTLECWAFV